MSKNEFLCRIFSNASSSTEGCIKTYTVIVVYLNHAIARGSIIEKLIV